MKIRVIGIDPGSIICGYGVVESNNSKLSVVEYGVIKAKTLADDFSYRLKEIFTRLNSVIERSQAQQSAFESLFYAKNVKSIIKLSHARSAAILAATMNNLPIAEYSPKEVKKSVTGKGAASKEQVQFMMKAMLNIEETPEFMDVTDALAVAVCHILRSSSIPKNSVSSWKEYIKNNPDRIVKI